MITIRGDVRHASRVPSLIAGVVLTALLAIGFGHAEGAPGRTPPDPNLKVAFIGDSGNGGDFRRVLGLIKSEGAHMVLHQGDFDYAKSPGEFFATIDSILGRDFPYFASVGNHDTESWREDCSDRHGCYAKFLKNRLARLGVIPDDPDLDDQMYSVTYRGLKLVFIGESGAGAGDSIREQERCFPATFPYGCKGEWAKIYTRNQGATFGALFIVFNLNGDPTKAQGYFKNINGQIVDRFDITVARGRPSNVPAGP